jgi:hypothetical protein
MADGQIVTLAAVAQSGTRKLAEAQDHTGGRPTIGRASFGQKARIVKEVMVGDQKILQEYGGAEEPAPAVPVTYQAPAATPPVQTAQPQQVIPKIQAVSSGHIKAGTELAKWAVEQDAKQADTPWEHIKVFLGEPPYETKFKPKRIRVQMTGGGLGKVTIFVSTFSASNSLVILGFPLDGQTSIIEPPPAGAEDPIVLVVDNKTYKCLSGGWSTEVHDQLLVALPIVPTETA